MKAKSFLDLMPEDERERAIERANRRINRQKASKGLDISPAIYDMCELGYFLGWDALLAVRRGFTMLPDGTKEPFTEQEAKIILEGVRKVWFTKLIEESGGNMVAFGAANSKSPGDAFNKGTKEFQERAKIG
jgi:hypothetical protein